MTHPYRAHQPTPDDKPAPNPHSDQDIDTLGTEADDEYARDLAGPTGEAVLEARRVDETIVERASNDR